MSDKEARIDDYIKEHPHAVVDEGEAMAMAEATKEEEEGIIEFKETAEVWSEDIIKHRDWDWKTEVASINAREAADEVKRLQREAEEKATRASDVYKSINSV